MLKALRMLFLPHSSERVAKTGTGGTLLAEAIYINLSLHYLEQVILTAERHLGCPPLPLPPLQLVSSMKAYCENRWLLALQLWWFALFPKQVICKLSLRYLCLFSAGYSGLVREIKNPHPLQKLHDDISTEGQVHKWTEL